MRPERFVSGRFAFQGTTVAQPAFIAAPVVARPYGASPTDWPIERDRGVDVAMRRTFRAHRDPDEAGPVSRSVRDVERDHEGELFDDCQD